MSERKKYRIEYMGERTPEQVGDTTHPAYSLFLEYDEEGKCQPLVMGHNYPGVSSFHPDPTRDCDRCRGWGHIKHQSAKLPPMPVNAKPEDPIGPLVVTETHSTCPECAGSGMSKEVAEQVTRTHAKPFEVRPFVSIYQKADLAWQLPEGHAFERVEDAWKAKDAFERTKSLKRGRHWAVWDADKKHWR